MVANPLVLRSGSGSVCASTGASPAAISPIGTNQSAPRTQQLVGVMVIVPKMLLILKKLEMSPMAPRN
jgi:hypothetical protein